MPGPCPAWPGHLTPSVSRNKTKGVTCVPVPQPGVRGYDGEAQEQKLMVNLGQSHGFSLGRPAVGPAVVFIES